MNLKGKILSIVIILIIISGIGLGISKAIGERVTTDQFTRATAIRIEELSRGKIQVLDIRIESGPDISVLAFYLLGRDGTALGLTEAEMKATNAEIAAAARWAIANRQIKYVVSMWNRNTENGTFIYSVTICDAQNVADDVPNPDCRNVQGFTETKKKNLRYR